jgi:outer membrane receptor protein involved in Fe transport
MWSVRPSSSLAIGSSTFDPKSPQSGQIPVLSQVTGNSNLKPANAYTYYIGGVWSPGSIDPEHSWWGWANGFSAYINWFQVDQHNVIGTLGPQNVADLGSAAPPGNFVIRDSTGAITEVVDNYLNIGNSRNNGIEFGFNYVSKEYGWGKLDVDFGAVYLYNLSVRTIQGTLASGAPFYRVFNETDTFGAPDLKFLLSVFYSKTLFRIDTFRTGLTLHYTGSELDATNSANGTDPIATLNPPGYVHTIGNWTTLDWQISYRFGAPEVVTPGAPNPGYDKEGKKIVGEKAVAPMPQGSSWGIRSLLANTTLTFGINNVFDTYPPLSVDNLQVNYDTNVGNPAQRFFYVEVEKQF